MSITHPIGNYENIFMKMMFTGRPEDIYKIIRRHVAARRLEVL